MMLGVGHQSFAFFALNLLLSISFGSVILMLTGGIGEEGGWRGVLQPEMQRRWGPFWGTFLVGLIWGYWHLPVNLAGYNGAQHPILQALLIFQTNTVAMSFVLAWLVQRSGSIWPAALAHAANNVLQSGTPIVANDWRVDQIAGTLASIVIGAICAWLLIRRESQESAGPERIADVPSKELLRRAYEAAKDVTLKSAPGQQTEVQ
jgi:membrane protease YdiL (CAAX protease family)